MSELQFPRPGDAQSASDRTHVMLRISNPKDGPRVVQIWRDAVDATHDFLSTGDRRAIEAEVEEYLPRAFLWLAVDSRDNILGFMGLSVSHLDSLFVDPVHHERGVGRRLVQHALQMHPTLTTDVNEQNSKALGFYQRLGFLPEGRSPLDDQGRSYPILHMRLDPTLQHPRGIETECKGRGL